MMFRFASCATKDACIAATARAHAVAAYAPDSDFDELSVDVVRV
jgi:predicted nucleic acid-binding protein